MPWFDLVKLGILVFGKNEDLGCFAAGLIWLLSRSVILKKIQKSLKRISLLQKVTHGLWMEMLCLESVTLLYSAGLVCSLPYPIPPRSDRSLRWFWIPLFFPYLNSGLFFPSCLPACLSSFYEFVLCVCFGRKISCLPAFQLVTGKGKVAQLWVLKLLGGTAGASFLLLMPQVR